MFRFSRSLCSVYKTMAATRWGCAGPGKISWDFFTAIQDNLPATEHEVSDTFRLFVTHTCTYSRSLVVFELASDKSHNETNHVCTRDTVDRLPYSLICISSKLLGSEPIYNHRLRHDQPLASMPRPITRLLLLFFLFMRLTVAR